MTRAELVDYDPEKAAQLSRLVLQGEGMHLEFKRKASHPDKIARELIAFANSEGGTLLVGVDDNRSIPGLKFPDDESIVIHKVLEKNCRPGIGFQESIVAISENRFILHWYIPQSERRPHYYVEDGIKTSYIRVNDQTIKASREMCEVLRRSKSYKGGRIVYGEAEQKIMQYLELHPRISLKDCSKLIGLNRFMTSRKLVRLVLASILKITPSEKGDDYSRV